MITKIYDVLTSDNELYELIKITGEDDTDCEEQLDKYLDTKQNCHAFEHEEDTN